MNIYIDLDDTLIHSVYGVGRNPGKRTVIQVDEEEVYHSLLRPVAKELLASLRNLGPVSMLTTARRDYALAHNSAFALGFSEDEIFARDDYICKIKLAYGEEWVPVEKGVDKNAILIDNLSPATESSRTKSGFLGIGEDRYIQIREFDGKDPKEFSSEVEEVLARVVKLAGGEGQAGVQEMGALSRGREAGPGCGGKTDPHRCAKGGSLEA